ncbi:TPA: SET domain-containing protein-lysine N-methyltransferase [Candidatus Falkowbacteria bacterium]|nr:SET domain-containing protein-lysine N-methyltransferase [Candidatus Falkowbacteria bacterium]
MLMVKTTIGPSNIDGIGLFADQLITKGTPVWKFARGFDLQVGKLEIEKLAAPAQEQFKKYSYLNPATAKYILCFDDARFFNHSETPNCDDVVSSAESEGLTVANKDIQPGEELTCNYRIFDADFDHKNI